MGDALEAGRKRTQEALENDPKRSRTSGSKVLHVRALPGYTTEQELVDLCKPFGNVVKVLLLQDKNQAFVEMAHPKQAADVLAGLEYSYPTIRNKRVYWQYSERECVEAKTAVYVTDNRVTGQTQGGLDPSAPTTVLLSITEVTIPITLEAVHTIGAPFGSILRIITFNKANDYQALLEYATSEEANAARLGLDGKDVYEGCCHIRANFSNKNTLVVKQNDNRSWDYTLGRGPVPFAAPMGAFTPAMYYGYSGFEGAVPGTLPDPYAVDPYAAYGPPAVGGPPAFPGPWGPPQVPYAAAPTQTLPTQPFPQVPYTAAAPAQTPPTQPQPTLPQSQPQPATQPTLRPQVPSQKH